MDIKTITTYEKMAEEYDLETIDFWKRFPRTFFDSFIQLAGERVLDIRSGPGRDGLILKEAGKDVTCLDASEEMVRRSTARGLVSIVGDFNKLPFGDGLFDAIWSYTALLHISKATIDVPFAEIARVIKKDGIFRPWYD